jgi:hypothetical protein
MPRIQITCYSCGAQMEFMDVIGRSEECPKCSNDVRSCRNCKLYDTGSANQCREPMADPVPNKDRSNFCAYFKPSTAGPAEADAQAIARAKLEALFKKT